MAPLPSFKMESYKHYVTVRVQQNRQVCTFTEALRQTNWSRLQHSNELMQKWLYGSPFPYGSGVVPNTVSLSVVQTHSLNARLDNILKNTHL